MTSQRSTPQQLVEHALASSTADDCITIVRDVTSANLRWANNTLTTNGVMTEVSVTVISFAAVQGGVATGSVSGSASTPEQVSRLAAAAGVVEQPARVHLKVDTGLARNGAPGYGWDDLFAVAAEAEQAGAVEVVGLWSHLAAADEPVEAAA